MLTSIWDSKVPPVYEGSLRTLISRSLQYWDPRLEYRP